MSLTFSNLTDGTTTLTLDTVLLNNPQMFVNVHGTQNYVQESMNVASLTDNAVGDFTMNLINNWVDEDFSVKGHAIDLDTIGDAFMQEDPVLATSTAGVNANWENANATNTDFPGSYCISSGELA